MPDSIRFAVIALALMMVCVGGYHRVQSQRSGERLDRTKEGWPILIGIRLFGLMALGSSVALLINPTRFPWASRPMPLWTRWIGVTLFAVCVGWLMWMFRTLGRNLTDTVIVRRDAYLVEQGPYRFVRNPMYTGVLISGIALGMALGTWLVPVGAAVVFTLMVLRTRTEEQYLIERFGDRYREYMRRVGRYFPRLRRLSR